MIPCDPVPLCAVTQNANEALGSTFGGDVISTVADAEPLRETVASVLSKFAVHPGGTCPVRLSWNRTGMSARFVMLTSNTAVSPFDARAFY